MAALRKLSGTSQEELAGRVGTAIQVLSRLERGVSMPSLARLEEIANALGVELRELFSFDEPRRGKADAAIERLTSFMRRQSVERIELIRRIAVDVFKHAQ